MVDKNASRVTTAAFGLFVAAVFLAGVALCAMLAVYFNSTDLPFLGQFFAP
jgi:hypothetical protein